MRKIIGPKYRSPRDEDASVRICEVEDYLQRHFEENGWKVSFEPVKFGEFTTTWGQTHNNLDGRNIIIKQPSFDPKKRTLIIAAHHDTVPDAPGADDNGSGLVLLLSLAKELQHRLDPAERSINLILISFDFEEIGLVGSEYFAANITEYFDKPSDVLGVIVLETLGFYTENKDSQFLPTGFNTLYRKDIKAVKNRDGKLVGNFLTNVFNGNSKFISKAIKTVQNTNDPTHIPVAHIRDPVDKPIIGPILKKLIPSLQNLLRSDHTPFWMRNIPAVMLTDTANFRNPNYHQPSDTIETIDFQRLLMVRNLLLDLIDLLLGY